MPITIQPATLKYKKSNGTYQSIDCLKGDTGSKGDPGNGTMLAPAFAEATANAAGSYVTYDGGTVLPSQWAHGERNLGKYQQDGRHRGRGFE